MPKRKTYSKRRTVRRTTAPLFQRPRTYGRATPYKMRRARNIGLKNARTGGLLGIETKFLDTARVGGTILAPANMAGAELDPTGTGCTGCLSAPAQGDTASSRDGFKIAMKSIQVEGVVAIPVQVNQSGADYMGTYFVALVLDTQTNGAQLNSEDVFTNPGADTSLASSPLRNMSYVERFKVLKTKRLRISPLAVTFDGTNIEQEGAYLPFKFFVKLGGLPVKFTAGSTTADVAGVVDNSLHIIAYATDVTLGPVISYNARLRFIG